MIFSIRFFGKSLLDFVFNKNYIFLSAMLRVFYYYCSILNYKQIGNTIIN